MTTSQEARFKLKVFGTKIRMVRNLAEEGGDFIEEVRKDPFFFQEQRIADAIKLSADAWAKVKSGSRIISAGQLQVLAERFKLDVYLGPAAWLYLLDETPVAVFRDKLEDAGYGRRRPRYETIQAVLDDLALFTPSLTGLAFQIVHTGRTLEATRILDAAHRRKFIDPDQANAEASIDALPEGARVRIRLDLDRPSHVVVLDLCAGTYGRGFHVTVLAPSFICQTTPLVAGKSLPTRGTGRVIVVAPPPDRHHLLAFVSEEELEQFWPQQESGFPELTARGLGQFIDGVSKRGPGSVRVLSRPYRVVREGWNDQSH